ncbi:hypothetical protein BDR03DRAFT_1070800 [Suillus americanus]|nr:hypothetical protein BDR03DRAFT_1070800 [Suillus americanus]
MAHCPMLDSILSFSLLILPLNRTNSNESDHNKRPSNLRLSFWVGVDYTRKRLGLSPIFTRAVGKPGEIAFVNSPPNLPGIYFFNSTLVGGGRHNKGIIVDRPQNSTELRYHLPPSRDELRDGMCGFFGSKTNTFTRHCQKSASRGGGSVRSLIPG